MLLQDLSEPLLCQGTVRHCKKGLCNEVIPKHSYHWIFLKDFIYLFLQKGREKERERNINAWLPLMHPTLGTWPEAQASTLTGNWTSNTLVRKPTLSPLSHTSPGTTELFCYCFFFFLSAHLGTPLKVCVEHLLPVSSFYSSKSRAQRRGKGRAKVMQLTQQRSLDWNWASLTPTPLLYHIPHADSHFTSLLSDLNANHKRSKEYSWSASEKCHRTLSYMSPVINKAEG